MDAVLAMLERLERLPLEEMVLDAVKAHESEITELNKQQLDRGIDADGKDLGEYKNRKYKGRLRPVDLQLTGDYRDSFGVEAFGTAFNIGASDPKEPVLQKRYGKNIQGLTEESKQKAGRIIRQPFIDDIRNRIL